MSEPADDETGTRDWRVSATLLAVWILALFIISRRNDDIPLSMLAIATVFFVMLIPAMNDLVRSIEKLFHTEPHEDQTGK
jgi:hypothetical protein